MNITIKLDRLNRMAIAVLIRRNGSSASYLRIKKLQKELESYINGETRGIK